MIGQITVTEADVTIQVHDGRETSTYVYERPSIEAVEDAAQVLAEAMQLGSEDLGRHCQLISKRDQTYAMLQDMVKTFAEHKNL